MTEECQITAPTENWAAMPDRYSMWFLCNELDGTHVVGSQAFDEQIAAAFGRDEIEPWTQRFEVAAKLFDEEFGRSQPGWKHGDNEWTRQCFMNGCNGISWTVSDDDVGTEYHGSGPTDAIALCVAMIKARYKIRTE